MGQLEDDMAKRSEKTAGFEKADPIEAEFYGIDCDECGAPEGFRCKPECPSYVKPEGES